MTSLNLKVPDMACSACAETITKAVQGVDTLASIHADTDTKEVTIVTSSEADLVKQAIADAGYTVES